MGVIGIRIPEGFYINPEDYAKRHGISVATAKRKCARGDLKAVKIGRNWFIPVHPDNDDVSLLEA